MVTNGVTATTTEFSLGLVLEFMEQAFFGQIYGVLLSQQRLSI